MRRQNRRPQREREILSQSAAWGAREPNEQFPVSARSPDRQADYPIGRLSSGWLLCLEAAAPVTTVEPGGPHRCKFASTMTRSETASVGQRIERCVAASTPDRLWAASTYTPIWTGFLYLAVVLDVPPSAGRWLQRWRRSWCLLL